MRLIDADKLIERIEEITTTDMMKVLVEDWVDSQPTAFDVDKVVKEIKNAKNENGMVIWRNDKPLMEREQAIEIVKAGGIDE